MSPIISPSGGGGSGGSQSFGTTFSTDPNTFIGQHVFDFGGQCLVKAKMVASAFAGDGETFGANSGDVFMDSQYSAGGARGIQESISGTSWKDLPYPPFSLFPYQAAGPNSDQDIYDLNTDNYLRVLPCLRYLVVTVALEYADTGSIYAGANHPVLTVSVTGSYL